MVGRLLRFYPGEAVTLLKDCKQQTVVTKFAFQKGSSMGSRLEAGQAEGGETSYKATAVIFTRSDEGLHHGSDGGTGLER